MKRQIISTIAAVAVIVAALTGCSGNKENSSQSTTTSSSTTSVESSSTTSTTDSSSTTSTIESSSTTTESSSSTAESTVSTSEPAPESTSESASSSESKSEVSKKTISLVDVDDNYYFGDIEVPLENNGEVNEYLQQIYDKGIAPEGTYAGTEILLKENGRGACIIFRGNSVNHGNVPVYDFGYTTDWEPTPIEEDDKIWDKIILPERAGFIGRYQKGKIGSVDFNKNGTFEMFEASIISMITSDSYELRGIIYL